MTQERRALVALVAGAVCIGFAPIFVRLTEVGLTATAFWRVALALPVLALVWYPRRHVGPASAGLSAAKAAPTGALALAGLFFAADLAVWHQSVHYTSVANATLLANLAPVFVTAGAVLWLGERVGGAFVAGLVLALGGAALLVADSFTLRLSAVGGDLLGVLAAVFYSGYLLSVSRLRQRTGVLALMGWSTLASALALLPLTLALGEPLWPATARGWLVVAGLALVSQVLGQGLIAWAMAHLPAAFSAVSLLVQPVAAALLAWALLGEAFGAQQALGGGVVLAGIVLCRRATARPNAT